MAPTATMAMPRPAAHPFDYDMASSHHHHHPSSQSRRPPGAPSPATHDRSPPPPSTNDKDDNADAEDETTTSAAILAAAKQRRKLLQAARDPSWLEEFGPLGGAPSPVKKSGSGGLGAGTRRRVVSEATVLSRPEVEEGGAGAGAGAGGGGGKHAGKGTGAGAGVGAFAPSSSSSASFAPYGTTTTKTTKTRPTATATATGASTHDSVFGSSSFPRQPASAFSPGRSGGEGEGDSRGGMSRSNSRRASARDRWEEEWSGSAAAAAMGMIPPSAELLRRSSNSSGDLLTHVGEERGQGSALASHGPALLATETETATGPSARTRRQDEEQMRREKRKSFRQLGTASSPSLRVAAAAHGDASSGGMREPLPGTSSGSGGSPSRGPGESTATTTTTRSTGPDLRSDSLAVPSSSTPSASLLKPARPSADGAPPNGPNGNATTTTTPTPRAVSAPYVTHDFDEVIPPAIARRLEQERLLAMDPRLSRVDKLIETWDRDGLPLSTREVASRQRSQGRRRRVEEEEEEEEEEHRRQEEQQQRHEEEEQRRRDEEKKELDEEEDAAAAAVATERRRQPARPVDENAAPGGPVQGVEQHRHRPAGSQGRRGHDRRRVVEEYPLQDMSAYYGEQTGAPAEPSPPGARPTEVGAVDDEERVKGGCRCVVM